MPRAIWSGSISFGLVNVPVRLHSATEQKDVSFHQFDRESGDRIHIKRVAEDSGREIDYENIVKGYEVSKGRFVIVTPEELEAVEPGRTRTIDLEDFVDLTQVDPIHFEKTYYLEPEDSQGAKRAYALLRESMASTGRVAIGRFVMRSKQYLVTIRPVDEVLYLETMFFPDEVRDPKKLDIPAKVELSDRERRVAKQLIESLATDWDADRYHDTYRKEVLALVKRKEKGEEIVTEQPREKAAPVTDLLAALEASISEAKERRTARPSRAGGTSKARPAGKKTGRAARKSATRSGPLRERAARKAS